MKKYTTLTIILPIVIFLSCTNYPNLKKEDPSTTNDKLKNEGTSYLDETNIKNEIEDIIKSFDTTSFQVERFVIKEGKLNKKTLDFFHRDRTPKKLVIRSYDQIESTSWEEIFYFGNDSGYPITYTYKISEDTSVQSFWRNRDVISYIKGNGDFFTNNLDEFIKEKYLR